MCGQSRSFYFEVFVVPLPGHRDSDVLFQRRNARVREERSLTNLGVRRKQFLDLLEMEKMAGKANTQELVDGEEAL